MFALRVVSPSEFEYHPINRDRCLETNDRLPAIRVVPPKGPHIKGRVSRDMSVFKTRSAEFAPGVETNKCLFDVQLFYQNQMWDFAQVFSQAELVLLTVQHHVNSKYLAS
jgi:hypothetical protein